MPKLIRLYISQVLVGFAIAAGFVGLLLWADVAGLWSLVSRSDIGVTAVLCLWLLNGIVFAGVQFAWKIMAMAETGDRLRGGGRPAVADPVPAVAGQGPRRRRLDR